MKYTIDYFGNSFGWGYRVTLWFGRVTYAGETLYVDHRSAVRAAKATGATPKEQAK
jgi:hypothetical protein